MATAEPAPFLVPDLPVALLEAPLDYLVADHDRHRAVCAYLRRAAEKGEIDAASALGIARFLAGDFQHHLEDEQRALYPVLRRRSREDAEFVAALRKVEVDYAEARIGLKAVISALHAVATNRARRLSPSNAAVLVDYARQQDQRLAYENSVIMVIAEVRLRRSDLEAIRDDMKARRGLAAP